jgi:hypothetical protein
VTRLIFLALCASLAACSTTKQLEPRVVTQEVLVPVATPCVPDKYDRTRPDYPDSNAALRAAPDAAARYQLLWAGRGLRAAREAENEAVIAGCVQ